jgi:hypothetical protein
LTSVKESIAISRYSFAGAENIGEIPMCDYSLHAVASRPAKVGEKLVTTGFYGTCTRGFAAKVEPGVAVCLPAGTELAFEQDVKYNRNWLSTMNTGFRVARVCMIEPKAPEQHHDALSFPDGTTVVMNALSEGQYALVLQLPVIPHQQNVHAHAEKASIPSADPEVAACGADSEARSRTRIDATS